MSGLTSGIVNAFVSYKYTWTIPNFCLDCKCVGEEIRSPMISLTSKNVKYEWVFKLYPRGQTPETRDYCAIYLDYLGDRSFTAGVSFSVVNSKNQVACTKTIARCTFGDRCEGFPHFLHHDHLRDRANGILDCGKLTILCEISVLSKEAESGVRSERENVIRLQEFDKLERLVDNKDLYSDVSFRVEDKLVYAHKCLLANSSQVFAAMFQDDEMIRVDEELTIKDVTHSVFVEMLRFVYTGTVDDIEHRAEELLVAADKYALDVLRLACEEQLAKNLGIDNALHYFKLADENHAASLRSAALEYIVACAIDIVNKPEFIELPYQIVCEICRAMANKHNN